jgi:hypothetical protein
MFQINGRTDIYEHKNIPQDGDIDNFLYFVTYFSIYLGVGVNQG